MKKNNPWKGLESYKYSDAQIFYGRDQELIGLSEIIRQNTFSTIYGVSGAGKTSIINAGLCPLLAKEQFLPVYIRLNHGKDRISYDQQIIRATENALINIEGEVEKSHDIELESEFDQLWLYFHSHTFWTKNNHKIAPILFIDQFEEIFTKNDDVNDIWSFFNVIDSLQYNMPTERILDLIQNAGKSITFGEDANFRMVFSMREDFLPRLEDYCFEIPALRRNRVGLKCLNGLQAIEVMTKPCPDVVSREVAIHIISKVVGKKIPDNVQNLKGTFVDTSILSLFCTELYNFREQNKNSGIITKELVDLYGGNILEWFYDRNMQILPKKTYIYLENHLLTHNGYRNAVAVDDLLENNVTQEQIDILEDNRIIRVEDFNHNLRVEFTHDVLCKIAKKRKDSRYSILKERDETSARRAFTLDTSVFALILVFLFVEYYYAGFDTLLGGWSLFFLPIIGIFHLLFIHRSLADKNFSIIIGSIYGCLLLFGVLLGLWNAEYIYGWMVAIIPFLFFTAPLLYNIYTFYESKVTSKKQKNILLFSPPIILFILTACTVCYTFWYISSRPSASELTIALSPLLLLCISPFYIISIAIRKGKFRPINAFSVIYATYYILLFLLYMLHDSNVIKLVRRSIMVQSDLPYKLSLCLPWAVILVFSIIYFIAYIRQPKEVSTRKYIDNVLEIQLIKKYKSIKTRFFTILFFFSIMIVGLLGTNYNDYLPFVTLPLLAISSLYVISLETKKSKNKHILTPTVAISVFVISEVLLCLQYYNFTMKYILLLLICSFSSFAIVAFFFKQGEIKKNKWMAIKVSLYACLISFLLPCICVGYNMLNPQLADVSRVWHGQIGSNQNRLYFLTIQGKDGNKGVMDYSGIIIAPQYNAIYHTAEISQNSFSTIYPFIYFCQTVLGVVNNRDEDLPTATTDEEHEVKKQEKAVVESPICFYCTQNGGTRVKHNYEKFIYENNKFGRILSIKDLENITSKFMPYFVLSCDSRIQLINQGAIHDLTDSDLPFLRKTAENLRLLLSSNNPNITTKERQEVLTKIFINNFFWNGDCRTDNRNSYNMSIYRFEYIDSKSPVTQLFIDSYNKSSFELLMSYKGKEITTGQVSRTIKALYPLLVFDKDKHIQKAVFGEMRKKYAKRWISPDIAYYLLFCNDVKESKEFLEKNKSIYESPNSSYGYDYYENLAVLYYFENNTQKFKENLTIIDGLYKVDKKSKKRFLQRFVARTEELDYWGVKQTSQSMIDEAFSALSFDKKSINTAPSESESIEEALHFSEMAFDYEKDYQYDMVIRLIDKAISLCPHDPRFYDWKGTFYLHQGRIDDAVEYWKKALQLNPNYYETDTELNRYINNKGLNY